MSDSNNDQQTDLTKDMGDFLNQKISPALAAHGGFVNLVKVENNEVFVELGGGCRGCPGARATIKYGVENAVKEAFPQITSVVDVTDHAAG